MNSAVQGSGADKLKAAMVALQGRLGDGAALPRGTCRLEHSVRDPQAASDMAASISWSRLLKASTRAAGSQATIRKGA